MNMGLGTRKAVGCFKCMGHPSRSIEESSDEGDVSCVHVSRRFRRAEY